MKTNNKAGYLKRILSNTLWMIFDKVFILIFNLFVTVRIVNYYGATGYGTYQYAISVVALFEILVTFVNSRVVKKRYLLENNGELVWNTTITRILFATLSLILGVIYLLVSGENEDYNVLFIVLLFNSIIVNLRFGMQNRYEYILESRKIVIASNIALIIGGMLQLLAISFQFSILALAIISTFSSLVSLSIVYVQYRKDFGNLIRGHFKVTLVKKLIMESLPLAIAASCAIIYARCDSIMIGNMLSKEDVGIYAIAIKISNVLQMAKSPISESVFPKMIELYSRDKEQYGKRYIQVTAILTWIYILGIAISFMILPYAFKFLNTEYAEAFPIYQVYAIGTFFMYNAGLRAGHYTLINHGNILMYSQILSVVVNVVLNYLLIKEIGIYGAAIATGITQGLSLMIFNLVFGAIGREVFMWQIKGLNPIYIFKK